MDFASPNFKLEHREPQDLKDRLAVVTGAVRGIGLDITLELVSRGCNVIGTYRNSADEARNLEKKLGKQFVGVKVDITKGERDMHNILSAISRHGNNKKVDIIVNNAALSPLCPLKNVTEESFTEVLEGNVVFPALLVKALLPHMSRSGTARIINISSEGSHLGRSNTTAYSASKAALESMTRTWAKELGQEYKGLTCNALALGLIHTSLYEKLPEDRKEYWGEKTKETPVEARIGKTRDVASVVGFLSCDRAEWVSGQCIAVNGGSMMIV